MKRCVRILGEMWISMKSTQLLAVAVCLLVLVDVVKIATAADEAGKKSGEGQANENISPEMMYQKLFKHKRAIHLEAVKGVMEIENYEKQYKMVSLLTEKIVKVIGESKIILMESGFTPGDPFPTEEKLRDAYSQVAENLAFFGDILLRLPDIVHDIMKRNKENSLVISWAISFCNETQVYQGSDGKLLHLMGQELGILEKDEDYVNPYKQDTVLQKMAEQAANDVIAEAVKKAKKKQERKEKAQKRKGPRLRGEL